MSWGEGQGGGATCENQHLFPRSADSDGPDHRLTRVLRVSHTITGPAVERGLPVSSWSTEVYSTRRLTTRTAQEEFLSTPFKIHCMTPRKK